MCPGPEPRSVERRVSPDFVLQWVKGGSSSGVDAFGRLRSLRARSALDGVSWVQGGLVETAVGRGLTAGYKIRAVVCSLPRASLLLGARFGLLSKWICGDLGRCELGSVSQHCMHDDREAAHQSDARFAHR